MSNAWAGSQMRGRGQRPRGGPRRRRGKASVASSSAGPASRSAANCGTSAHGSPWTPAGTRPRARPPSRPMRQNAPPASRFGLLKRRRRPQSSRPRPSPAASRSGSAGRMSAARRMMAPRPWRTRVSSRPGPPVVRLTMVSPGRMPALQAGPSGATPVTTGCPCGPGAVTRPGSPGVQRLAQRETMMSRPAPVATGRARRRADRRVRRSIGRRSLGTRVRGARGGPAPPLHRAGSLARVPTSAPPRGRVPWDRVV